MFKSNHTANKFKKMQEEDDIEDHKTIPARLQRGFSKTGNNIELVGLARDFMLKDINLNPDEEFFAEKTEFTFTLPDLTKYPENFKGFLFKELVESSMLVSLEQEGHLNWWTDMGICDRLLPMVTAGDGNCLLHSASLSMWGFHDRVLALRRALNTVIMRSRHVEAFKRRWRHQQSIFLRSCGLVLEEEEWRKEWEELVEVTSLEPRNASRMDAHGSKKQFGGGINTGGFAATCIPSDAIYESLEEFHVFILCHIIKRPIIVMANPFLKNLEGENFSPVPFRGIYLPLERTPEECCTSPLLLAYNLGHFCALAAMQSDGLTPNMTLNVPLVDSDRNLLPIHFFVDPIMYSDERGIHSLSQEEKLLILKKYLDVRLIGISNNDGLKDEMLIKLESHETSINKSGKRIEMPRGFDPFKRRRSSLQSTNYIRPFAASLDDDGAGDRNILCAKLQVKRTPFANELVKNYLKEAQSRFEKITKQKVGHLEEIRRRSKEGVWLRHVAETPPSSGRRFNIFNRSNHGKADLLNVNKSSAASNTLPLKTTISQQENQNIKSPGNLIASSTNSNVSYRKSVPVGFFDRRPEVGRMPFGVASSVVGDKKDGPVKAMQKLLGQNKAKADKSIFYRTEPSTTVLEGKSKFYTNIQEDGILKLPQILHKNPSPPSSTPSLQRLEEANFSTFPSRSSTAKHVSSLSNEGNMSSLPKIKSKSKEWKKSFGFNTSTSDPNIFENNDQSDNNIYNISSHYETISSDSNYITKASSSNSVVLPCRTDGCRFFGSKEKRGFCSVCYAEQGYEAEDLRRSRDSRVNDLRIDPRRTRTEYLKDQYGYPFCQTKL